MRVTIVAALLAIGSHSTAQGWSITADAPVAGTASAYARDPSGSPQVNNSAVLPVGPVPLGTFLTCSAYTFGGSGAVDLSCVPSVVGSSAPLAFTASASSSSFALYQSLARGSASGNASIVLTLHAPQPVGGLLRVRAHGSASWTPGGSASSRIDLDVNADGTTEGSAQAGTSFTDLALPLQVLATGAVIRLTCNASTFAFNSATTSLTVEAQFFPGEPVVAPFATFSGAATMSVNQALPGMVTLWMGGTGLTPVLMAGGGTAISVPLWPFVTVLVSPDVLIATPSGSLAVPLPPLPPGTAFFFQGLLVDSVGTLRSTNSVRALWL